MTDDIDEAAVECIAKTLWEDQEESFPAFTRMAYDAGSEPAREYARRKARAAIRAYREWVAKNP